MVDISPNNFEIDKVSGAWVLTHWLGVGTPTLRLKISHKLENDAFFDPNDMTAEIRFGPCAPFLPRARERAFFQQARALLDGL